MAASLLPDSHRILTVTDNGGGDARYTTAAAHGLDGSQSITVSGVVGGSYDATDFPAIASATTFDMSGIAFTVPGTGGQWQFT